MNTPSNYPPGVTGAEPEIAGEVEEPLELEQLDDEDVVDLFLGAGALGFSWWRVAERKSPTSFYLAGEAPHEPDCIEGADLDAHALRRATWELLRTDYPALRGLDWFDPEVGSDVDCEIADCVLQQAVFGGVHYG